MFPFPCDKCESGFTHKYQLDNHVAQKHTHLFTADRVQIYNGMPVWDYNLDVVTVDLSTARAELSGDVWFSTKTPTGAQGPLMNGTRLTTRHPSTRQTASDAWDEATKPVTVTVELTWPDGSQFIWSEMPEEVVEKVQELLGHNYDLKV